MVYKKYIRKNGKIYGPYIYHSKRVDGKVVSEYIGPEEKKDNKKIKKFWTFFVASLLVIALGSFVLISNSNPTGNIILKLGGSLNNGTLSDGKLNFVLQPGELLPENSIVSIENNGTTKNYKLKDLISNEKTTEGNFSLKEGSVSGYGTGYGVLGKRTKYPTISFELTLSNKKSEAISTPLREGSKNKNKSTQTNETNSGKESNTNSSLKANKTSQNNSTQENFTSGENSNESSQVNSSKETNSNLSQETQNTTKKTSTQTNAKLSTNSTYQSETQTTKENSSSQTGSKSPNQKNTPSGTTIKKTQKTNSETTNSNSEATEATNQSTKTSAPITGNIVSGVLGTVSNFFTGLLTGRVVETSNVTIGEVSKENPFIYNLNGKKATLVPGSVKLNGEILPDNTISLEEKGNELTVTTNYSINEKGFGSEYSEGKSKTLSINLNKLNQTFYEGKLNTKILYNENEIMSFTNTISSESLNPVGEEIKIFNQTQNNSSQSFESFESISAPTNLTQNEKNILTSTLNETNFSTTVSTYKNKYIVDFSFAGYSIEHSYPQTLSNEELQNNIERDKYLWLKDIINKLSTTNSQKTELTNLSSTKPIF